MDGTGCQRTDQERRRLDLPANGNASASVTITHLALFDAATLGNRLFYAQLSAPKTLSPGDVLSFAANAIVFGLD